MPKVPIPKAVKVAGVCVAVLVVVFCVGFYALDRSLLGQTYARYTSSGTNLMLTDADVKSDYPFDDIEFQMDGQTLRGHVYGPSNNRGLVVFRHGIFSQHQDYLALITALVDKGWKVLAYDAIGCGQSDGDSVKGFAQSPLDVRAAVDFAYESGLADGLDVLLFGHSWGGYGVAGALDFPDVCERVAGCVTMSGFDTPNDIIMESATTQMGALAVTQKPFIDLIGWLDFGADANRSAALAVSSCGLPVLVVHGTGDLVVSYNGASIIAERERITNPQVSYLTESDEGRNGHNTYFYSRDSQTYLSELTNELEALQDKYGQELPADIEKQFLESVDKRRANSADPDLVNTIDSFFTQAIAG